MTPERRRRMEEVAKRRQSGLILVLENIHDPHNAAAILRTCDAFGIQEVWLVFDIEKAFNPRQVGKASSSSANRWLTFRKFKSSHECIEELKAMGYSLAVTALSMEGKDPYTEDLTQKKLALVVGNEHRGVSEAFIEAADCVLTLPMKGYVESLNVSVATALLLGEVVRQRGASDIAYSFNEGEVKALVDIWSKER